MIWLIAVLLTFSSLFAQSDLVREADSLFHAADYERVELLVLRSERQADVPDSQRVTLELLGGYSMIMLNRELDARAHFTQALNVDSTLTLDPIEISPKFRVVFDDVKREWLEKQARREPEAVVSSLFHKVPARPESHALNLIIPGSGFIREGKPVRGLVHLALQATSAALWLTEISQTSDARKRYLAAETSGQAASLYDEYDSHHRRMWTFGLTSGGIYLLSQFDLILFRHSESVRIIPTESGASINVRF